MSPPSVCIEYPCGRVADPKGRGRCKVHARERNAETHRTGRLEPGGGRIYDQKRWLILRRRILVDNPMCQMCTARGVDELATDVDHITPVEDGGEPWALSNLRPLCRSCHSSRHARERVGDHHDEAPRAA